MQRYEDRDIDIRLEDAEKEIKQLKDNIENMNIEMKR